MTTLFAGSSLIFVFSQISDSLALFTFRKPLATGEANTTKGKETEYLQIVW